MLGYLYPCDDNLTELNCTLIEELFPCDCIIGSGIEIEYSIPYEGWSYNHQENYSINFL